MLGLIKNYLFVNDISSYYMFDMWAGDEDGKERVREERVKLGYIPTFNPDKKVFFKGEEVELLAFEELDKYSFALIRYKGEEIFVRGEDLRDLRN